MTGTKHKICGGSVQSKLLWLGIFGLTLLGLSVSYLGSNLKISYWFPIAIVLTSLAFPILLFFNEKLIVTVVFLGLVYPYRLRIPIGPLNSFTLVEVLLVVAWVVLLLRRILIAKKMPFANRNIQLTVRPKAVDLSILAYGGIGLLSFIWASSIPLAIRGAIPIFENIAFYYLIVLVAHLLPGQVEYLSRLFLLLGVFALGLSIVFFFGGFSFLDILPPESDQDFLSVQTRLGSPAWGRSNYFASALTLFLPTYVSFALLSPLLRRRLGFALVAAIGIVVFVFTWSRGGYVALALAFLVMFYLLVLNGKFTPRNVVFAIFIILLLGLGFSLAVGYLTRFNQMSIGGINRLLSFNDQNIQVRLSAWSGVWGFVTTNLLGVGLGNSSSLTHFLTIANVHNAYLQVLLETGWIGFTIMLSLLGFMFKENVSLLRHLKGTIYEPFGYGLLVSFIAVLVNIAFESSFEGVIFGWLFWTTQGLVRMLNSVNSDNDSGWRKRVSV